MTTFISPDDTWSLMAITCGWVAFSIYAEQTWQWASKISGAIIALIGAVVLTNFNIIPTSADWFDSVIWGYVVPIAIPLLLFQCDMRKIWVESGRLLVIYLIGSIGTAVSAVIAYFLVGSLIPYPAEVSGILAGSYIGGGVNLASLSAAFKVPGDVLAAITVADNLVMALFFFTLISLPTMAFFRKTYKHPFMDEVESQDEAAGVATHAANYWQKKPISIKDIAFNVALAVGIVAISGYIATYLGKVIEPTGFTSTLLNGMFGNKYLIITTIAMLVATLGSKPMSKLAGSQEIGTFLIYLFLFVIGVPASVMSIIHTAPWLFVFCLIMVSVHLAVSLFFGKLFKFNLEEIILASNANIGGPTTAAAMAISKGWIQLVGPVMLVGTLGYVVGAYIGMFIGNLLGISG